MPFVSTNETPHRSSLLTSIFQAPPTPPASVQQSPTKGELELPPPPLGLLDVYLSNSSTGIEIDGYNLTIPTVSAVSRSFLPISLSHNPKVKAKVDQSRAVVEKKLKHGLSIYGVSTGFGGSANTRTDQFENLGLALLQHQHAGILPSSSSQSHLPRLPLTDPMASQAMPVAWVRAAMLIRLNSLIRGHSAVRFVLIERMHMLLEKGVTPLVPVRGSISASGDLIPLSYVAGVILGEPSLFAFYRSELLSAPDALAAAGIEPLNLVAKEHLGILNGTSFSAGVGALVMQQSLTLTVLSNICTAMGVEALNGSLGSFHPFIHDVRPHAGQIECAGIIRTLLEGSCFVTGQNEDVAEVKIEEDTGKLRQDRYPLRTAPQWLGPLMEDMTTAWKAISVECNSTTDNPLIDGETGNVHHGGNFQALSVTMAMERVRSALASMGKLIYAQLTEMMNPALSNGLPPNLSSTDPSINYHGKGIDIAAASYVSELNWLASNVSTHVQSAELHNQAVNSLALIAARATVQSLEVLGMLIASYLYALCQALDQRTLQAEYASAAHDIIDIEMATLFGNIDGVEDLKKNVKEAIEFSLNSTTAVDGPSRMTAAANSSSSTILNFLAASSSTVSAVSVLTTQQNMASGMLEAHRSLLAKYLTPTNDFIPETPQRMGRTAAIYNFIRSQLSIPFHGYENLRQFEGGLGSRKEPNIGQNVAKIYEAIRDGAMDAVVKDMML